jgi:hypothetical protein
MVASCRPAGPVTISRASRDSSAEPIVEFNLLSDRRDLERLMSGFRKMVAFTFEQVMNDDEALEAFVRKATIGVWQPRAPAAWAGKTIRLPSSTPRAASGACRACGWSMPRSSRRCPAPTPIFRR